MADRKGRPWTARDDALLSEHYPKEATKTTAARLKRTTTATYGRANVLGVRKGESFLASEGSGRVRGNRQYRAWTEEELEEFRRRYPHEKTSNIASDLNRTTAACYGRAGLERLKKTEKYLASPDSARADGTVGQCSRFRKGHVPANKGEKGWQAGGRSVETQFTKGQVPANYCPIGSYRRTTKERFWVVKVQNHGLQRERWIPLHKLVWTEHNGPIPPKHVIRFKDGDVENVTIENLECISMKENMRRNTIHNLPRALVDVIRTKGALTRQINMRSKEQHEKQN